MGRRDSPRLPELPAARRERYGGELGLSPYDAGVLTADVALADYFEMRSLPAASAAGTANWVTGEFSRLLNQHAAEGLRASGVALPPARFAELVAEVEAGRVSGTNAKAVLSRVFESGESPRAVIEAEGLSQVSDSGYIADAVAAVIGEHASQVAEFRGGKQQIYGFLVGQVMKRIAGRADARSSSTRSSGASWQRRKRRR